MQKRNARCAGLVLAIVAAGYGCSGGGEVVDCAIAEVASVVVGGGTTQTGFLDLSDGADMTIVFGLQGLYMVTPSVRVHGMYPGVSGRTGNGNDPEILIELLLGATIIGGSARANLGLTANVVGDERLGIFTPFTGERVTYLGQTITIRANVSDACGNSASDELYVVPIQ